MCMKNMYPRGFTLIELLIVVGIMSILLVYSIPQFVGFNKRSTLNSETEQLVNGLKLARVYATSNIQNQSTSINKYRIDLTHESGYPLGCYRGFTISGEDSSGSAIVPVLETVRFSCPIVLEPVGSTWGIAKYQTITGKLDIPGVGSQGAVRVWYPSEGYRDVTIDAQGKVQKGDFVSSTSLPSCNAVCVP